MTPTFPLPNLTRMQLGAFSISLAVKNLGASRAFYEKLGFKVTGGNPDENWLILKNGDAIIGLFEGMFEKNILTFNPGWNNQAEAQPLFTDVRELHQRATAAGFDPQQVDLDEPSGPGSFVLVDPDGNPVLIDQHI